jgi:hypothetical protein
LEKIRRIKEILLNTSAGMESKMMGSTQEFFRICEEVDRLNKVDSRLPGLLAEDQISVFDRIKKSQEAINQEAS